MFLRALNNLLLLLGLSLLPLAWAQNPEAPASANQLLERLQGRWQQKYWREHQMQENYQDVTINWRGAVQEMTITGKRIAVFEYQQNGRVFVAWGGRVIAKELNQLEVVVEYFSPYDQTAVHHAQNRQATLYSGASLVGSVQSLSANFSQGLLYLSGPWRQNVNSAYHRPIWLDVGYVNIGNKSLTLAE